MKHGTIIFSHLKIIYNLHVSAATSSSNVPIAIYPALNYGYCNDGYITFRHNKYQCQCASYTAGPHCAYECPYQYINDTYVGRLFFLFIFIRLMHYVDSEQHTFII